MIFDSYKYSEYSNGWKENTQNTQNKGTAESEYPKQMISHV